MVRVLIHEFGCEYSGGHLTTEHHKALGRIGAKLFRLGRQDQLA